MWDAVRRGCDDADLDKCLVVVSGTEVSPLEFIPKPQEVERNASPVTQLPAPSSLNRKGPPASASNDIDIRWLEHAKSLSKRPTQGAVLSVGKETITAGNLRRFFPAAGGYSMLSDECINAFVYALQGMAEGSRCMIVPTYYDTYIRENYWDPRETDRWHPVSLGAVRCRGVVADGG